MKWMHVRMGLGLGALALLGWIVFFVPSPEPQHGHEAASAVNSGPFAKSMEGTVPDGDLRDMQNHQPKDQSGRLAYAELRRMFDYYLSAVGEQSIEAISRQIRAEVDRNMSPTQALEAKRLLDLYLDYKRALVDLEKRPDLAGADAKAMRKRFLAMQDLRTRFFSEVEIQGMYGFDDAYDLDAIARMEVSQDPTLNDAQKKAKFAALDAAMPATLREERDAPRVVIKLEEAAQAMRARGASEDEIYRMRTKELNAEAAARLAEVDREEAAWKARIAHYLLERGKVLKTFADAAESERQAALTQLQQSLFDENERRRLPAYEQ